MQHELISNLVGLMKEVLYVVLSPDSFNLVVVIRLPLRNGSFKAVIEKKRCQPSGHQGPAGYQLQQRQWDSLLRKVHTCVEHRLFK